MGRKTFNVEDFKAEANKVLAWSIVSAEMRHGWIAVLEYTLHSTGNYKGFRYLMVDEVPLGELPGIRMGVNGNMLSPELRFQNCDETRRQYA